VGKERKGIPTSLLAEDALLYGPAEPEGEGVRRRAAVMMKWEEGETPVPS